MKALFIVDGSLDRPLLHSQGLPLLRCLGEMGVCCYVLSFEEDDAVAESPLGIDLSGRGIVWRPTIVKKGESGAQRMQMILAGLRDAFELCRAEKIMVVHCRSYRPAVIGMLLKVILGCGFLFDMRGFLIEEQVMLGRWRTGGLKYRLGKMIERWCLKSADAIVTTSPQFRQRVIEMPFMRTMSHPEKVISIPNCVDTRRYFLDPGQRAAYRRRMGWDGRLVVVFAGEARRWEAFDEMIAFYKLLKRQAAQAFLALYLYGDLDGVNKMLAAEGLDASQVLLATLSPDEVPGALRAADAGILFRTSNPFTRQIASPIKFAEYLASGLPVVINPGVGDTARILHDYQAGVVVDPQAPDQLWSGAKQLLSLLDGGEDLRRRCREAAFRELSLDLAVAQYHRIYTDLAGGCRRRKSG